MSNNINGTWKKNLQQFLKGHGKLNINSFDGKAIIVPLHGGNGQVQVVSMQNARQHMIDNNQTPSLYYQFKIVETPDRRIKTTAKEATEDSFNLAVVSPQQSSESRNIIFAQEAMLALFKGDDKTKFDAKISQIKKRLLENKSKNSMNIVKMAIADKLMPQCPLIYVKLFLNSNCEQAKQLSEIVRDQNFTLFTNLMSTKDILEQRSAETKLLNDLVQCPPEKKCEILRKTLNIDHNAVNDILNCINSTDTERDVFFIYVMLLQETGQLPIKVCDQVCMEQCDNFIDFLVKLCISQ